LNIQYEDIPISRRGGHADGQKSIFCHFTYKKKIIIKNKFLILIIQNNYHHLNSLYNNFFMGEKEIIVHINPSNTTLIYVYEWAQ